MKPRADTESDGKRSNQEQESQSRRGAGLTRLRCLNCGQQAFVATEHEPPEICQFCRDMTTWQVIE